MEKLEQRNTQESQGDEIESLLRKLGENMQDITAAQNDANENTRSEILRGLSATRVRIVKGIIEKLDQNSPKYHTDLLTLCNIGIEAADLLFECAEDIWIRAGGSDSKNPLAQKVFEQSQSRYTKDLGFFHTKIDECIRAQEKI